MPISMNGHETVQVDSSVYVIGFRERQLRILRYDLETQLW